MATHGEYICTVVGRGSQCEKKEFKSRNQLHRHLATVHQLVLTKKDTYVQASKFLLYLQIDSLLNCFYV